MREKSKMQDVNKTKEEVVEENMPDFGQYEDVKVGEKEKTKIIEVRQGKQVEFRSDAFWEALEAKGETKDDIVDRKDQLCCQVLTDNGARMILTLPKEKKVLPNSNLGLFKKTYGEYPKEDLEVETKIDEKGFRQIILEK